MNKQVRGLNLEEILFFDIETVRRNKVLDVDSKEFELYAWSIRDKTTGFIPPAIEVIKHYDKNGALSPVFNKTVVISVGYIKGTTLYYKALVGTQAEIITEFYNLVVSTGYKVCGHNIIGFDLPTLRIKAFEEGLDLEMLSENINDSGKKPWDLEKFILDTMKIITGTYFFNISLDAACMLKGIKSSKDDISGAYVSQVYYEEGVPRIARYCNKDVIATAELFLALQGKENFITNYVDKGDDDLKEKEEVNVLDHILASGQLNEAVIAAITDFATEEKLNKEDVLTLVKAALSRSKNYQAINEEDFVELQEALGLLVDYSLIQVVVDKGNLAKLQANSLIKEFEDKSAEVKAEVIELTEKFLIEKNKIGQVTAKKSLEFLKEKLA